MIVLFSVKDPPQIWKVGERPTLKARNVVEIKIDGEELSIVRRHLHRMPHSNNDFEFYYGDMAKYIARAIGAAC
jgi:hypothetical protein